MGGVRVPFLIANGVEIKGLHRGCIEIDLNNGRILFGFGGSIGIPCSSPGSLAIDAKGKLHIKGTAAFSKGTMLRISGGNCVIGEGFYCNKNCQIFCNHEIIFGDRALLGCSVEIRDGDGHHVYQNGVEKPNTKPIHIGNHVWLAAGVSLLKGARIAHDSVVGCRSCVTKTFDHPHVLIAGIPAKVVQEDIDWSN